jgi:hypothetical protein
MQTLIRAIIIGLVISCSQDSELLNDSCAGKVDLEMQQFPQLWKLTKISGGMLNTETTGANMYWQETIQLNADGTFIKHRVENNIASEASGTYSFALAGDEQSVELTLTYTFTINLVVSCYGQLTEKYILLTKCKLIGTWAHCDGDGLHYEKL